MEEDEFVGVSYLLNSVLSSEVSVVYVVVSCFRRDVLENLFCYLC